MERIVRRLIRSAVRVLNPMLQPLGRKLLNLQNVPRRLDTLDAAVRMAASHHLRATYAALLPETEPRSPINHHEYRAYSQHGEDGILLYIYSKIGVTNRRFVEFGVEDGTECNAANLAINFGFSGLLMDGDESNIERGRRFYRATLGDEASRVTLAQSWVTAENINDTIRSRGFEGEIDLLSIDIDGNDYWVWKAIEVVQPRIVIVEYNAALGAERSETIPYDPKFNRWTEHESGFYFGASLAALTKLGREKGYALVGCESSGANAFYVRKELLNDAIAAVAPEQAHYPLASPVLRGHTLEAQYQTIEHLPFVRV
jgi:hypothetical protein